LPQHHVRRFQIAVDDTLAMRVLQGIGHLGNDLGRLAEAEAALFPA
jgi:hypothetical protein